LVCGKNLFIANVPLSVNHLSIKYIYAVVHSESAAATASLVDTEYAYSGRGESLRSL